ncbi:MAG: diacylglycerol kinase [Psychrobium sp.]|nr:diacylglycerol kinase [Psychrobium sp.]
MSTNESQFKPNGTGALRIFKAFRCSMLGFKACFKHESAFRQELLLCLFLLPLSVLISPNLSTWTVLICSMLFLLFAEVVNSAIEALADQISTDHHELIGRAKDLGSSAVFIAMVVLSLVWFNALYSYWLTF